MRDAAALLALPTNTCQRRRPSVPTVIETQVVADCTAAARGKERGGAMPKKNSGAVKRRDQQPARPRRRGLSRMIRNKNEPAIGDGSQV